MRARFRDLFLRKLRRRQWLWPLQLSGCEGWDGPGEFELRCAELAGKQWIAYVQEPFTDVSALTRYLGQYTHRIAISDWRILEVGEQTVQVATRGDESVTLDGIEFVRRFMLHLPPSGLSRIHHYGLYSAAGVRLHLSDAWSLVAPGRSQPTYDPDERWDARLERLRGVHPHQCPRCRKATMQASRLLEPLARRFAGRFHQRMQRMLR